MQNVAEPSPTLAIVGPTGAGKTSLALRLAQRLHGHILCADSVQVYRGFNIGAAKATPAQQARVPHHLLDEAAWNEPYDACRWASRARDVLSSLRQRHVSALICGGSGLYIRALRDGLADLPAVDAALRRRLEADWRRDTQGCVARLTQLDPQAASRIDPLNGRRVLRALEICLQTGEPVTQLLARRATTARRTPLLIVVIDRDDDDLRQRLRQRAAAMLQAGLLDEVETLLHSGVTADCRPMRALCYRQCVDVLQGRMQHETLADAMARACWQYARRQRTWWRHVDVQLRLKVADETVATDEIYARLSALRANQQ